jgi:predicted thioesterase
MKSRPKVGEFGELAISTDLSHGVEFHGDGMPAVVSTPHLVGFLERTARVFSVEGNKVQFQTETRNRHEVIVRGLHKRAVARTESLSRRVKEKSS